ncbi:hypothetical protein K8R33_03290 [archaeon]|nr:hypothetical protein [archaeon]
MAKGGNPIGSWAFLIGVLLAIVLAFVTSMANLAWLLVVLGIIIGLFNISSKETQKFLFAGAILVIVGSFAGGTLSSVRYLNDIFANLVALFAPATIVVALKSVFELARR